MYDISFESPAAMNHDALHSDLLERRRLLKSASVHTDDHQLVELLGAVDAALIRIREDTFGTCDICKAPIEADLLGRNPLSRVCLECLSSSQRRALEHDLTLASTIQSELLPDPDFKTQDWVGHYSYQPYGRGPVSGDFCDVILNGNDVLVLFGDISGKGVSAALLMSHLSAIFRVLATSDLSLVEMMEQANRMFCAASPIESFATLVALRFRTGGEVEIANAGHVPPLLHNGRVNQLPAHGVPIGLFCESGYASTLFRMEPGDRLVLVTDGTIESADGDDHQFGLETLVEAVASAPNNSPRDLVNRLLAEVELFRNGRPAEDDITLMVIQRSI